MTFQAIRAAVAIVAAVAVWLVTTTGAVAMTCGGVELGVALPRSGQFKADPKDPDAFDGSDFKYMDLAWKVRANTDKTGKVTAINVIYRRPDQRRTAPDPYWELVSVYGAPAAVEASSVDGSRTALWKIDRDKVAFLKRTASETWLNCYIIEPDDELLAK